MANTRTRNYAFILYPQEDERHKAMLEYFTTHFRTVHINHDKDTWSAEDEATNPEHKAGEPKKPHTHLFVHFENTRSTSGVLSLVAPYGISYTEPIEDTQAYLRYMIHDLPSCDGKYKYSVTDLIGDDTFTGLVSYKDTGDLTRAAFKSLLEFVNIGWSLMEITELCVDDPVMYEVLRKHTYLISQLVNQRRHA